LRIRRENAASVGGTRRASLNQVSIVSRAANPESSGPTGVFAVRSPGLTNHCAKTYPLAAACDLRGPRGPLYLDPLGQHGSLLPSRIPFGWPNQRKGRRLSKEFFQ